MKNTSTPIIAILELTREMYQHARNDEWNQLLKADDERAMIVAQLNASYSVSASEKSAISEILDIQQNILQIAVEERARVGSEYKIKQEKLAVSSCYLNNTEDTMTR